MTRIGLFFLFTLVFCQAIFAQNYVPNYSFENDSACPNNYNQVNYCTGWKKSLNNNVPQYHTEYLHACGAPNFSVPSNTWGNQAAATGQAYMAEVTMAPQVQTDYRENIYTQLMVPLQPGVTYEVSLKVSFTDNSQYASNNFGVKFATTPNFPINNISHVYSTAVINDKQNWVTVSGSFVADSAYQYIGVGNFFTDANTISVVDCPGCPFTQHGYFVDDVCVIRQSPNLVPNPGFEIDSACPNNYNQVTYCSGWEKSLNNNVPQYHTEYLHACGTPNFSVPSNTWGYQTDPDGQAYMAMVTMAPTVQTDYRENIYTMLSAPLQIGTTYNVTFNVSSADNSQYVSNNIGVKFATTANFPINGISQVYSASVINDKQNWVTVSGSFIADSSYSYIAIGNFLTDANTTSVQDCPGCSFTLHGYYIDDIVVSEEVLSTCEVPYEPTWISTTPVITPYFSVYPNPASAVGGLEIEFMTQHGESPEFYLFDVTGTNRTFKLPL
jgi:hypothetical protein